MKYFIFLCVFFIGTLGFDQLEVPILQSIFPFVSSTSLTGLCNVINHANNTVRALLALDDWMNDDHWVTPPNTVNTAIYGRLTKKEYAWNQAIGLIGHRDAVKGYIKYLGGATRVLKYLDEGQIDKMHQRFWRSDTSCSNNFTCTESSFLTGIDTELGAGHENVTRDLTNLASAAHQLEDFQVRLGWKLEI